MNTARTSHEHSEPIHLGTLERQVMNVLWDTNEATIREIITALGDVHAYTTIATVLGNLDRKGMIRSRREGRSVHYGPRRSRPAHAAEVMEHALSASNDRTASILHFVRTMNPADVDLLRDYLGRADHTGAEDGS